MRRGEPLPRIWLAPGAVSDPRGLLRFGSLRGVLVPVGPLVGGPDRRPWTGEAAEDRGRRGGRVLATGVGGVEHEDARPVSMSDAVERLRWASGRGLGAVVRVRGASGAAVGTVVGQLCRSLEGDAVAAVEVDLRGADDQTALRILARTREAAPRDLLLLARLSALQPDLVGAARGAVAGGAGAVVVCGSVPLGPGRWWSGPATAAVSRAGVRALAAAGEEHRWPAAPLVAAGGVHGIPSARAALADGAAAVMLGTALWTDPTLLHQIQDDLEETR